MRELNKKEKSNLKRASNLINNSFEWIDSPEGYEYWKKVFFRLREMAK